MIESLKHELIGMDAYIQQLLASSLIPSHLAEKYKADTRNTIELEKLPASHLITSVQNYTNTAEEILESINNSSNATTDQLTQAYKAKEKLIKLRNLLEDFIQEPVKNVGAARRAQSAANEKTDALNMELDFIRKKALKSFENLEEKAEEFLARMKKFETQIGTLEQLTEEKSKLAEDVYNKAITNTNSQSKDLQKIMGFSSETAIRGNYQKNSEIEKQSADAYRRYSVGLLLIAAALAAWFIFSTQGAIPSLSEALQKITMIVVLSVPAAYFSRESTRHRELQNLYLQKALILATIDPYVSSLPSDDINKIKSQLASTLFNPATSHTTESFPINTQELILAIINKLELKK